MKSSIFILCCFLPGLLFGQPDSLSKKVEYYTSFVSGVMIGSSESADEKEFSASVLTIHGMKFNSGLKVGLGVGFDTYYDLKVYPLIASVTFDQEQRRHGLFIQLNSGYSIVHYTKDTEGLTDFYDKGGFMINPLIGYRIKIENIRIYWQTGYKYQVAEVGYSYPDWSGTQQSSRHYELNRFVLQLGVGLR